MSLLGCVSLCVSLLGCVSLCVSLLGCASLLGCGSLCVSLQATLHARLPLIWDTKLLATRSGRMPHSRSNPRLG